MMDYIMFGYTYFMYENYGINIAILFGLTSMYILLVVWLNFRNYND